MTLREIVKQLRKQGHSVVYKKRTDGSIAILSIDSERFTAASRAGNRRARQLSGETVSASTSAKRKAAGVKGGIARGAQRAAAKKPKGKPFRGEKEYQRLRRLAKKKGLKPIGKRQIKAAMKRGEHWSDIRKKIIKTLISRFTKVAGLETRKGVAMYIREKGLSNDIADFLMNNEVMMSDLQELHDAAYDAVQNGTDFNESYWMQRMKQSAEEAKTADAEAREFAREARGKKK